MLTCITSISLGWYLEFRNNYNWDGWRWTTITFSKWYSMIRSSWYHWIFFTACYDSLWLAIYVFHTSFKLLLLLPHGMCGLGLSSYPHMTLIGDALLYRNIKLFSSIQCGPYLWYLQNLVQSLEIQKASHHRTNKATPQNTMNSLNLESIGYYYFPKSMLTPYTRRDNKIVPMNCKYPLTLQPKPQQPLPIFKLLCCYRQVVEWLEWFLKSVPRKESSSEFYFCGFLFDICAFAA